MITQQFGTVPISMQTLDTYTAAVLSEAFLPKVDPSTEWRSLMDQLAALSCSAYRGVVTDPTFLQYFRAATPEPELARLNIGSRPARRPVPGAKPGGVETLRAIPWVFAWTQTRLHLPAWLGVGDALQQVLDDPVKAAVLKDMYRNWPWWYELVDLLDMVLAKAELHIAENYDRHLLPPGAEGADMRAMGETLRQKARSTVATLLAISGKKKLSEENKLLQRSLAVRNPYIDILNLLQANALHRLRELESSNGSSDLSPADLQAVLDVVLVTLNGVSAGMRNTG